MEHALFSEDGFDVAPDEWSDEGFTGFIGQHVVIRSRNVFMRMKKAEAARNLRMLIRSGLTCVVWRTRVVELEGLIPNERSDE